MLSPEKIRLSPGCEDSLKHLRSIFDHLSDGVFLVKVLPGGEFEFEAFNRQTALWTGITLEQVQGRRLSDVMPSPEAERVAALYRKCVESGEVLRYEETPTAIRPELCFQTTLIPACDDQGRVVRIVGLSRDVSEQKRAARALLESQEIFAKAFRHGPYAMLIVRLADGAYVDVNAAFEQLFECRREDVVGTHSLAPSIWPDAEVRERLMQHLQGNSEVRDYEARLRSLRGNYRDTLLSCDVVLLGGERHVIVTVRDVTEQREAERAKLELEAQLRQAQKLEALGTMAGGIAHDFNNILGAMVAFIDLIRIDVNDRTSVLEHVGELKNAAGRARDLVQQILTFSRVQKPTRSITKVDQAVRDALKLLRSSLPSSVSISASFDEAAPAVLADASQIHQVVMNLGTNAAHAMRERGGELALRIERHVVDAEQARRRPDLRPGRYTRMLVKDSGHGMDELTLKRMFEPFFTTKRMGEGSGLGLAVVHGIVRDHDGAILVESRLGQGTSIEVYLPEHLGEPSPGAASAPSLPRGRGERILVVDDEEALCDSLTQLLKRLGYQVEAQSSSEAALQMFREDPERFALVLTDFTMPRLTGLELAQCMLELRPKARVVLMTGFSGTWTPASVRALGLVNMLVKPLTLSTLANGIASALGPLA
jgi:two-component system cell cycle sensor histidine kinase/response regulator CckA